jgi:hypothetical protein
MDQTQLSRVFHLSRCGAKTKSGTPCQRPPVEGKNRCRLHGGLSPGAPRGSRNGNYTNGEWTTEAIEERRWLRSLVRDFANEGAARCMVVRSAGQGASARQGPSRQPPQGGAHRREDAPLKAAPKITTAVLVSPIRCWASPPTFLLKSSLTGQECLMGVTYGNGTLRPLSSYRRAGFRRHWLFAGPPEATGQTASEGPAGTSRHPTRGRTLSGRI